VNHGNRNQGARRLQEQTGALDPIDAGLADNDALAASVQGVCRDAAMSRCATSWPRPLGVRAKVRCRASTRAGGGAVKVENCRAMMGYSSVTVWVM
jgi:hypothetical protein